MTKNYRTIWKRIMKGSKSDKKGSHREGFFKELTFKLRPKRIKRGWQPKGVMHGAWGGLGGAGGGD